jgi:hypothetical protein
MLRTGRSLQEMQSENREQSVGRDMMRLPYVPPTVARVRVETTRLASGKQDAQSHCTWHYHDTPANCPNS